MALTKDPKVAARSNGSRGNTWLLFHAVGRSVGRSVGRPPPACLVTGLLRPFSFPSVRRFVLLKVVPWWLLAPASYNPLVSEPLFSP